MSRLTSQSHQLTITMSVLDVSAPAADVASRKALCCQITNHLHDAAPALNRILASSCRSCFTVVSTTIRHSTSTWLIVTRSLPLVVFEARPTLSGFSADIVCYSRRASFVSISFHNVWQADLRRAFSKRL